MPATVPEQQFLQLGNIYAKAMQQGRENKRQNAMLELDQKQYGLQEQRVDLEQNRYDQAEQERQATIQAQAKKEGIGLKALAAARGDKQSGMAVLQELGLPAELADDADSAELYQALAQQYGGFSAQSRRSTGALVKLADGTYAFPEDAAGKQFFRDPAGYGEGQSPSDQRLYEWLKNQSPEDQQAFLEMRRGYAGPEGAEDLEAARGRGRVIGGVQGERDAAFEGDLAKIDDEIARNNRLIEDFKAGKYQTGYVAGMLPNYRTAAQDLSREQGKDVIGAISSATFGALSEGEREFLRNLGISESNTEESNINLLTRRGAELKRARDRLAGRQSLVPSGPGRNVSGGAQPAASQEYDYVNGKLVPRQQ